MFFLTILFIIMAVINIKKIELVVINSIYFFLYLIMPLYSVWDNRIIFNALVSVIIVNVINVFKLKQVQKETIKGYLPAASILASVFFMVIFLSSTGGVFNSLQNQKFVFFEARQGLGLVHLAYTSFWMYSSSWLLIHKPKTVWTYIYFVLGYFTGAKRLWLTPLVIVFFYVIKMKKNFKILFLSSALLISIPIVFTISFYARLVGEERQELFKYLPRYFDTYVRAYEFYLSPISQLTFYYPLEKLLSELGLMVNYYASSSLYFTSVYYPLIFNLTGAGYHFPIEVEFISNFGKYGYVLSGVVLGFITLFYRFVSSQIRDKYLFSIFMGITTIQYYWIIRGGLFNWVLILEVLTLINILLLMRFEFKVINGIKRKYARFVSKVAKNERI